MAETRASVRVTLYGVTLESSFPFRYNLERSAGNADLTFYYHGVTSPDDPPGRQVYASPVLSPRGESALRLYTSDGAHTIVYPGVAWFRCSGSEIHAYAAEAGLEYLVEIALMGTVMAYWLERRGIAALHASAVVVRGEAVCFVAGTSRGKTTTACAFLAAGYPLLSDDIVPIRLEDGRAVADPAFPQMKLLPEQLGLLGVDYAGFPRIHPDFDKRMVPIGRGVARYHGRPAPVGAVYLLNRDTGDARPEISRLGDGQALLELLRHSFAAELVDAVDRTPARLARLAEIAQVTAFYRIRVPDGYHRLDEVRALVEALTGERQGAP